MWPQSEAGESGILARFESIYLGKLDGALSSEEQSRIHTLLHAELEHLGISRSPNSRRPDLRRQYLGGIESLAREARATADPRVLFNALAKARRPRSRKNHGRPQHVTTQASEQSRRR